MCLDSSYLEKLPYKSSGGFTLPRNFLEELKRVPELEIISVGFGDGEYREAQRLGTGKLRFGSSGQDNGGAPSFYRETSASKEPGPSWSDTYKLYSNSDLAISSAVPFTTKDGREGGTRVMISIFLANLTSTLSVS